MFIVLKLVVYLHLMFRSDNKKQKVLLNLDNEKEVRPFGFIGVFYLIKKIWKYLEQMAEGSPLTMKGYQGY